MHYGRYGRNSEDGRISPLFLGYSSVIRGYEPGSFTAEECPNTCPQFDNLIGSRMLVTNVEFRAPLNRPVQAKRNVWRRPGGSRVFADAGVAWTSATKPSFAGWRPRLGEERGRDDPVQRVRLRDR
jgi:outer membrane protein assembly factor BamA